MRKLGSVLALGLAMAFSSAARADLFTLDPTQSILNLSATFSGTAATPQPPSGFTTSYSGTIDATVGGGFIQFNAANAIAALSGMYQPLPGGGAGSALGNYGGMINLGPFSGVFAIRDLIGSLTSGSLPVLGGTFDAGQLSFAITGGNGDYNVSTIGIMGTSSLAGNSATNGPGVGSISIVNGMQTISIPIDVTVTTTLVSANDTVLHLTGNLVAFAPIPEPATYMLFGVGLLACAQRFRRGNRSKK